MGNRLILSTVKASLVRLALDVGNTRVVSFTAEMSCPAAQRRDFLESGSMFDQIRGADGSLKGLRG